MQESKLCDGMLNVVASLWRWKLASQAGLAEMAIFEHRSSIDGSIER